jgi:branched-chain amino acid transport system substrate-binding protein
MKIEGCQVTGGGGRGATRRAVVTAAAFVAAIGLGGGALLGLGCDKLGGGKKAEPGAQAGSTAGSGTILIGHYASMTGSEATFGVSTDNGVRLALAERNAKGGVKGRQVEVKTLDDASKSSEAGNVVSRLISEDHVVALLGEVASSASISGGKVAQQFGVPMISPSSTNEKVTQTGDMISRVCFVDDFQAYVEAKFTRGTLNFDKAAVLFDQGSAYSKGLSERYKKHLTELGGTIVTEQAYTAGDADVSAQLQTIKTSGAQIILLPGYYTDVGNIARQARKLGITIPFLGGDGWDSSKLLEIGGDALDGSYYSNHYSPDETRPEVQEFVTKYQAKFGALPDGLAALGYDAARVMFDAMDRAPSLGGKDLAAAIAATKGFPGVTGVITLDANRDPSKRAVVLQIKGGKGVMVATIWPKGSAEEKAAEGAGSGAGSSAAAEPPPAPADSKAAPMATPPAAPGGGSAPSAPAPAIGGAKKSAKPSGKGGGPKVMGDPDMGGE